MLRRTRFDRSDPVWKYLGETERNQGAVLQLTPDGIVPTLSQLRGRVLHVARADHLDIVGQFDAAWEAVAGAIAKGGQARRE